MMSNIIFIAFRQHNLGIFFLYSIIENTEATLNILDFVLLRNLAEQFVILVS